MSEYECPKCKRVYSGVERLKSQFCPEDGMHLRPKYVRGTLSKKSAVEIETQELTREQVNVHTLYEEFMRLEDFLMGEGLIAPDVPTWILERKKAYQEFQKKFSKQEMSNLQALHDSFKDFLYFKKNMSWTTLYRSGTKALKHLKSLRRLLIFLREESVSIQERVNQALGKHHVEGIGIAIVTGLLHTFYPDKYGVLNSRTKDTLKIIKREPMLSSNKGLSYITVNKELKQLTKELDTDLTTVDGFMWFISKRVKIITD